jgi:hypothetical protein
LHNAFGITPSRIAGNPHPKMPSDRFGHTNIVASVGKSDFGTEGEDLLKTILET